MTTATTAPRTSDVVVVGDGLIGLACAVALADAGCRVTLLGAVRPGQASHAAAGMLAPGVERATGAAHLFAVRARDHFPGYLAALAERTGVSVPLNRRGILQLALDEAQAAALRRGLPGGAEWLEPGELAALEAPLAHGAGAVLHPDDGAVDNRRLLQALATAAERHDGVTRVEDAVERLALDGVRPRLQTVRGGAHEGEWVVLAAGAWAPTVAGLPRRLPVAPVRGQMLAVAGTPLRHVVYGSGGYLVPREDRTLVGSTMEHVAFDASTTATALSELRATGARICPALADAPTLDAWAGLRPVTPDGLPVLGPDPDQPRLVYACGHSRNGILLAPLTGDCVAALVTGRPALADLSPFSITRFTEEPSA